MPSAILLYNPRNPLSDALSILTHAHNLATSGGTLLNIFSLPSIVTDEQLVVMPHSSQSATVGAALGWHVVDYVHQVMAVSETDVWLKRWTKGGSQTVRAALPLVLGVLPSAIPDSLPLEIPNAHPTTPPLRTRYADTPGKVMRGAPHLLAGQLADILERAAGLIDPNWLTIESFAPISAPLTEAPIVVAGGKGLGFSPMVPPPDVTSPFLWRARDGFNHVLRPFAAAIGGEIAATRAIIDGAGIDSAYQIGQSGKRTHARLYIAVGVSGAVQHLEGIAGGAFVVAINNDPHAPIFTRANVSVIGDLYDILPPTTEALLKRQSAAPD